MTHIYVGLRLGRGVHEFKSRARAISRPSHTWHTTTKPNRHHRLDGLNDNITTQSIQAESDNRRGWRLRDVNFSGRGHIKAVKNRRYHSCSCSPCLHRRHGSASRTCTRGSGVHTIPHTRELASSKTPHTRGDEVCVIKFEKTGVGGGIFWHGRRTGVSHRCVYFCTWLIPSNCMLANSRTGFN